MRPHTRPKGYRTINVSGMDWFWTSSKREDIVAINSITRERVKASREVMTHIYNDIGRGPWDERHEIFIVTPRHVSAFLKDLEKWKSLEAE